jgi:hypothetical protein
MIPHLQSPSVCVIDDEKEDYEPILKALQRLGLGCVHVKGDSKAHLPRRPFKGLRVVFTDLHLSMHVGKDAASHTAKVFSKVVSTETAPLIVVIWSKYQNDVLADGPANDEQTEAELFKTTLLGAFPAFSQRLVFLKMPKPKLKDRPSAAKWVTQLKRDIKTELGKISAFDALWAWEALVRDAAISVTEGLTSLAMLQEPKTENGEEIISTLPESLKLALRLLVREQGGHECSETSAPRHFAAVLAQSLVDHLEHLDDRKDLARHGQWLSDQNGLPKSSVVGPGINGFLLTSELAKKSQSFVPGNIYRLAKPEKFEETFGITVETLLADCYSGRPVNFEDWKKANAPKPILVEISPVCDVHQGTRQSALLLGGLIFPEGARNLARRPGAHELLPTFSLRWPADGFKKQSVFLAFFCRLKTTMNPKKEPRWLIPWFRLRELPTASLRNWHASHASRVGYVSLK